MVLYRSLTLYVAPITTVPATCLQKTSNRKSHTNSHPQMLNHHQTQGTQHKYLFLCMLNSTVAATFRNRPCKCECARRIPCPPCKHVNRFAGTTQFIAHTCKFPTVRNASRAQRAPALQAQRWKKWARLIFIALSQVTHHISKWARLPTTQNGRDLPTFPPSRFH